MATDTITPSTLGLKVTTPAALHGKLLAGLPFSTLTKFQAESGLGSKELHHALAIPPRTLARRKATKRLSSEESERLYRLARLTRLAVALFEGDRAAAREWLTSPARALSNDTPLSRARTEVGARQVEDLIGRLEHGVFS